MTEWTTFFLGRVTELGLSGSTGESIPLVSANCTIDPTLIVQCAQQIIEQAESRKKTGGVQISLLFNLEGAQIKVAEDIGRHSSVDKVAGVCPPP